MMNLFSVFDPTSYYGISINWIIMIFVMLFFPTSYFFNKSTNFMSIMSMKLSVNNMFKDVAGNNYMMMVVISIVTFMYLMLGNLFSLFPYIFSFTSHPYFSLGVGMSAWFSFFLMGWMKNFKNSAAHLVPEGSPLYLAPFMVLIETISHLMRPFTLSIRLAANMMAGHLIIMLLASISILGMWGFVNSLLFQSILLILEIGVSVIQGFVFSILLLLYSLEYY